MQNKTMESIKEVDLSGLRTPMIAVYQNPDGFPGCYVARVYDADKPTDTVIVKKTQVEIEKDIRRNTNMTFIPRGAEDVESLVGVWL